MIRTFKHRGLEKFFLTGSKAGIQPAHAMRLNLLLTTLNRAKIADEMNVSGWTLHKLKGSLEDTWSVKVNGNWRLTSGLKMAMLKLSTIRITTSEVDVWICITRRIQEDWFASAWVRRPQ